ncbi:helix-turn-helix domain-containing protein [Trabulsiella guamensis]|uniref:helix-turn-helix domain-containing protein n=1 Tax=Trabulsiella guamensis TaxID=158852 RepID=UPI00057035DC|nr:helix-turn-helix domain-containing protein [Trabulsiella guamensis]
MAQRHQDWHPEDIKAAVRKTGATLSSLSKNAGLAPDTLRKTLVCKWPKGQKIIAAAIGVEPSTIWPSRY